MHETVTEFRTKSANFFFTILRSSPPAPTPNHRRQARWNHRTQEEEKNKRGPGRRGAVAACSRSSNQANYDVMTNTPDNTLLVELQMAMRRWWCSFWVRSNYALNHRRRWKKVGINLVCPVLIYTLKSTWIRFHLSFVFGKIKYWMEISWHFFSRFRFSCQDLLSISMEYGGSFFSSPTVQHSPLYHTILAQDTVDQYLKACLLVWMDE